jgi:hypothetical protein
MSKYLEVIADEAFQKVQKNVHDSLHNFFDKSKLPKNVQLAAIQTLLIQSFVTVSIHAGVSYEDLIKYTKKYSKRIYEGSLIGKT